MVKVEEGRAIGLAKPENRHLLAEQPVTILAGNVIYRPDQPANIVLLRRGRIYTYMFNPYNFKEFTYNTDGQRAIVEVVSALSMLGEEAINGETSYSTFAEALTDCEVQYVDMDRLPTMLHENQQLGPFLVNAQLLRMQKREKKSREIYEKQVAARLAGALLELADSSRVIPHHVDQRFIADYIYAAREGVNRGLNNFTERNLIKRKKRRIILANSEKLRHIYELG